MKKIVYIAHPIGGDVENNLKKIEIIYAQITHEHPDVVPFAPYWITCHALDDSIPWHRVKGFEQNKAFFERKIIDELWVYGMSVGVQQEIEWAIENNIKIVSKIGTTYN